MSNLDIVKLICFIFTGIGILSWLDFSIRAAYHGMSIKQLRDIPISESVTLPKLSVIVTARNEEPVIERELESLLSVKYPNLEIIAIDDRSTDKTGEIIDRIAAKDSRLLPIHIDHLPQG